MHAQICCFANLDQLVLFHSRCRRRLRCLSSLMYIPRQHLNLSPALLFFAFSGRTEEEPQTKQLEFEDVWLASQVEPLQDNFDILGRLEGFPLAGR